VNKTVTVFFGGGYIYRYTPHRYAPAHSCRNIGIIILPSFGSATRTDPNRLHHAVAYLRCYGVNGTGTVRTGYRIMRTLIQLTSQREELCSARSSAIVERPRDDSCR